MNLLIGGTGFIGSVLADRLAQQGEEVVSVSRSGKGTKPGIKFITMDLRDDNIPPALLSRAKNIFILVGKKKQGFDRETEKRILERLLLPLTSGKQRLIYFSSVAVYGHRRTPATERSLRRPLDEYGQFKVEAESIIERMIPRERSVILRVTNVYGAPGDQGFIGQAMSRVIRPDGEPLEVHGKGRFTRDYILVDDVADICLKILSNPGAFGQINVATGRSVSGDEVVQMIERITERQVPRKVIDDNPAPQSVSISNTRLRKQHGYSAFTSLEEGLKKTFSRYNEAEANK